jgi:DNA/RNA endonuclease G (NUC1)
MMRLRASRLLTLTSLSSLSLLVAACQEPASPISSVESSLAAPPIRISEIHYDNTGADVNEAVEVSGPAGTDLTGWRVVLYNGSGGANYQTVTLSGTLPATCGDRGVFVGAAVGMQNGAPDGLALVDPSDVVVEFLSYEGTFTATAGPASGLTSVDIGVSEPGTGPANESLARNAEGTWNASAVSTFGACNDNGEPPPPVEVASITVAPANANILVAGTQTFTATAFDASNQPIAGVTFDWSSNNTAVATVNGNGVATGVTAGDAQITATAPNGVAASAALHVETPPTPTLPDTRFAELHYDNSGVDSGEAIEIEGPAGTSLEGWSVVLYDGTADPNGQRLAYNTRALTGSIPATCGSRGVVVLEYPTNGIQNGSPDGLALVDNTGAVVEFLSYEGAFRADDGAAAGRTSVDIGASEQSSASATQSLQRNDNNIWAIADRSFGGCNSEGPPPAGNTLSFSGRVPTDPALPVGFQDQIFATMRDPNGVVVPTTFTWSVETPDLASIDALGVMTALAPGNATLRATAADGTTATYTLPTRIALASTTAQYEGNAEFGEPADADASDDFLVRHAEFTASFNKNRGTSNWVSYNLEATHFGDEDRCDCFTFDPVLPAEFTRYTTADYTGAGTFHGYGIDRGHLARSFDRTSGALDNAFTFLFTNVVPQAADLNQGPWAVLESELGDLARFSNKEVYIVTGVAGNKGTIKNEGKIVIPESTWKVAVIMERNQGLADVVDYTSVQVIAVDMPNQAGVRNVPWQTYQVTVDAIEAKTGYDLLSLLPDDVEAAVESNTRPPIASIDGPYATTEGGSITASATAHDTNGTIAGYLWDFGDGATATGETATHTYAQDGVYQVRLTVTDNDGLSTTLLTTAAVSNVAPVVAGFPGSSVHLGESVTVAGSFSDPGADLWTATVDWGDGSTSQASVAGQSFVASHVYAAPGSFTVTVTVADDDAAGAASQTVTVTSDDQSLVAAIALVDGLVAARKLPPVLGTALKVQLNLARQVLPRSPAAAAVVLRAVVVQIDLLVRIRVLSSADAAPLRTLVLGVIDSIT